MRILTLLCSLILLINAAYPKDVLKRTSEEMQIKGGWEFREYATEKWYPSVVPGNVHTDLLNNKMIEDPFYRVNEKSLQWIGEKDWLYRVRFDVPSSIYSKNNIDLLFKGLDTYADVYLNGKLVLSADNMFREWKVDAKGLLKEHDNELKIHFRNVFDENLPKWENAPFRLQAFGNNDQADTKISMYSRKAGYHFGWDWGPRLITCGVWRPVELKGWDDFKVEDVQLIQKNVTRKNAGLNSFFEIRSDKEQKATLKVMVNDKEFASREVSLSKGENRLQLDLNVKNPKLWWTNGLGEQPLYNFDFVVTGQNGTVDNKKVRTGLRSLEVVREKDSMGTSLYVRLNGVPVFMKGSNYIPQDNFNNRVAEKDYRYIIKSAVDANMNMLRVWGGGFYQEDAFYDLCDEYGILVWQDIMFACSMYPGDKDYLNSVRGEVIDNVKRIRNYASLALYCGNNENEVAWTNWGWRELYSPDVQKKYEEDFKNIFYVTIPEAIKEADPTRYYHRSSPVAGFNNIPYGEGDTHYWGVWHGKEPFENFETNISRFVSEYGFQSYPEMSTIEKYTLPEDRQLHSEVMLSHQRCMADERRDKEYGNRLIKTYMDRYYREPKSFEDYVYVSQVLQAYGVKIAVEAHRRHMPYTMGTLYWQIDDCWPVASWSSIDYYGNWKALHYYAKKFFEPVIAAPVAKGDDYEFYIVSDKLENEKAVLSVQVLDLNGKQIVQKTLPVEILANTSKPYLKMSKKELLSGNDEKSSVILLQIISGKKVITENTAYFAYPKDLNLSKPDIRFEVKQNKTGCTLELTTDRLAKDVYITCDGNSQFSDNYFDLIPGRTKTIELKGENLGDIKGKIKIMSLFDSY